MTIIASIIIGIAVLGVISINSISLPGLVDSHAVKLDTVNILLENKERLLVVDIRSAEEYQSGHPYGAAHDNLDDTTLEKRVKTIQNRLPDVASKYNFVLIDQDGTKAKETANSMSEMGIQTFYLDGGMNSIHENIVTSSQTIINSEDLMQRINANEDIYLLDVRESDELLQSKIEGSVNVPLAEIFQPNGLDDIPTDKPVVVICSSGNRATIASYALAQEGINLQVLEGGIKEWNAQTRMNSGM